jgi:hypothetical protein
MRTHIPQTPQPIPGSFRQLSAAAIATAVILFPDPLGPRSSHACGTSLDAICLLIAIVEGDS